VIVLLRDTPKEAVCQVFEKVNTGGVSLTVFELVTATLRQTISSSGAIGTSASNASRTNDRLSTMSMAPIF
jgi:hypothetical protein